MRPFFSIVMPTRNRAKTLYYSLQTALFQDFGDYEIVVGDNASTDDTGAVVRAFGNDKIRYVRATTALPMAKNWEHAIAHARGMYILELSDDDGLLRNTLSTVHRVIVREQAEVVMWHRALYAWPEYPVTAQYLWPGISLKFHRNCLIYSPPTYSSGFVRASDVLRFAVRNVEGNDTPTLVSSAVHLDVLKRIQKKTGSMFLSYAPDTSSGITIPCMVDSIYRLEKVISVAGLSQFSTGTSLEKKENSPIEEEFRRLNRTVEEFDTTFMEIFHGSTSAVILDCIHATARHFPAKVDLGEIDMLNAYAASIVEYCVVEDRDQRRRLIRGLYRKARESHGIGGSLTIRARVTRRRLAKVVNTPPLRAVSALTRAAMRRPYGSWRYFNGDRYGFRDILGACEFFGSKVGGVAAATSPALMMR